MSGYKLPDTVDAEETLEHLDAAMEAAFVCDMNKAQYESWHAHSSRVAVLNIQYSVIREWMDGDRNIIEVLGCLAMARLYVIHAIREAEE